MSFLELKISAFKNARSTDPATVSLRQFLNSTKYRGLIDKVRAATDKAERDILKKNLPAATISGTFTKRRIDAVEQYNGIICIDIDADANPGIDTQEMKARICSYEQVAYAALSVSGKGVYAIVLTDNTEAKHHPRICALLEKFIKHYSDIQIDPACKDITRLRFVSYDTNAYVNESAEPFSTKEMTARWDAEELAKKTAPPKPIFIPDHPEPGTTTIERVEAYVKAIERNAISISEYSEWTNLGLALASEFGQNGSNFFERISFYATENKRKEAEKKYKNLLSTNTGKVRIGTFFHICNQHGIKLWEL